ncbi:amidohydrolase family protein, partial [Pseudomonas viridiflava]|uniref:amidohydrolase family protein n=1 Tax=Pseudomonas viridiflava TaxID=33069 RepID=UPI001F11B677
MTDDKTDLQRRRFIAKGSLLSAAAAILPSLSFSGLAGASQSSAKGVAMNVELILFNGQFHTVDREKPKASAVAISGGRFVAVGSDAEVMAMRGSATQVIDLKQRTVIPGLNDSHLHLIRGGLNYNLE